MPTQPPKDFASLLRRLRLTAGLTQNDLSERAGLSPQAISALERGSRRAPQAATLTLLLSALDVTGAERVALIDAAARARRRGVTATDDQVHPMRVPNNLPITLSRFVGRAVDLAALSRLLTTQALVTIIGPGGVGKSRLALEVGKSSLGRFPDGIWYLDVMDVTDAELPSRIFAVLAGTLPDGRDPASSLASILKQRHLLLVLDNCDRAQGPQLVRVADELAQCSTVRVLASARHSLGVSHESVYLLGPLPVPPAATSEPLSARAVLRYDSCVLFVERARSANLQFSLTDTEAPLLASVVQELGGNPLAILLAAANIKVDPIRELEDLEKGLRITRFGHRDGLLVALQRNHDHLSREERLLFDRLAVFAGGWTVEAAKVVCSDEMVDSELIPAMLASMVKKSLVAADGSGAAMRFNFLEPVRAFARERLQEIGEWPSFARRFAEWVLLIAIAFEDDVNRRSYYRAWQGIENEIANVSAAIRWCFAEGADAGLAAHILALLAPIWSISPELRGREGAEFALGQPQLDEGITARLREALATRQIQRFKDLVIAEWRQFQEARISFHERLTILTGANGAGKTTILNILASHFGWAIPMAAVPLEEGASFDTGTWPQEPLKVKGARSIGWIRYDNDDAVQLVLPETTETRTYVPDLINRRLLPGIYIPSHRPIFAPAEVCEYPSESPEKAFTRYSAAIRSRWAGDSDSKETPLQAMKATLLGWLLSDDVDFADGFANALSNALPADLAFEALRGYRGEVLLVTGSGTFPVDAVSGGIAAIIDLTWQIFTYSLSNLGPFVVLIDEPENHLHPALQRSILPNLLGAFPLAQFIVASHAPMVVTSVKDANVYALGFVNSSNEQAGPGAIAGKRTRHGRAVNSCAINDFDRAGTPNDIMRDVLGLDFTIPLWAANVLDDAVGRLSTECYTQDAVARFEKTMSDSGLSSYLPQALDRIVGT